MHKKRTKALIFSDMDITTKRSKKRANKMAFSTFRQKKRCRTRAREMRQDYKKLLRSGKKGTSEQAQALPPNTSTKRYL